MRSLTCKQAERWLDKVKEANSSAYKELGRLLRRYDKYNDEAELFRKMNEVLLSLPELTEDFNVYLEEGTKFVVNPKNQVKINEFVKFVRRHRVDLLGSIVEMVSRLSSQYENWSEMPYLDQGRLIKDNLREIVKDDPTLKTYFQESFVFEPDEILGKLKLDHLINNNRAPRIPDEEQAIEDISQPQKKPKREAPPSLPRKEYETQKVKAVEKTKPALIFLNTNQQKIVFKNLQKKIPGDVYEQIIKIIHLYHLAVITKNETLQMLGFLASEDFQYLKDIIESRETDRRKQSVFKPLADGDFHNLDRSADSYVRMPLTYPNICQYREKIKLARQNLNDEWVSVPRGTEESFNIRMKNIFQINMIKSEEQRYEYDIFKKRLQIGEKVLARIVAQLQNDPTDDKYYSKMLEFINMNIIQLLYKNATKEQKEEFQKYLASDTLQTLKIMLQRVSSMHTEISEYREIHGQKIWGDVAAKNFLKSLDFKTNQFKRIEKIKCKATVFVDELHGKSSYLQSRGRKKIYWNPFEDQQDFFSIVNSFQNISRREKCQNRALPKPQTFDVCKVEIPKLLPSMILAFEDTRALQLTHSFIAYYIDNTVVNQSQKFRCKALIRRILARYFDLKEPQSKTLSEKFNEITFFQMLDAKNITPVVLEWAIDRKPDKTQKYDRILERDQKKQSQKKREWMVEHQPPSKYGYLPVKGLNNIVFYSSENFYVFLRFLYILYERVIRMKEILKVENKIVCFQLLYFSCIRSKESVRFQDGLSALLQDSAYIFTTFYKVVESVCKSLNTLSTCPINSQSLLASSAPNEADYFYRLNRQMLQSSFTSGAKLVRCVFQHPSKLVYINCIDALYISDENNRELLRRRAQITHKIDYYAYIGHLQEDQQKGEGEEEKNPKLKPVEETIPLRNPGAEAYIRNQSEYCFQGNTIHMITLPNGHDCVVGKHRKKYQKEREVELVKNKKLLSKIV